ncbi:MAG: S1C family serine protease, partial [Terriglobales bacterium]
MANSRFSGLYLSGRTLALLLIVVGVLGAMAFYRSHATPAEVWAGLTHSTQPALQASQVPTLSALNQEQETLAKRVAPAVVAVNVTAHPGQSDSGPGDSGGDQGQGLPPDNPLSQFFGQFGRQFPRRPEFEQGLGSGIIISPDGYIVTNNHVVQDATTVQVTLGDGRQLPARVVGTDELTDLAVIKVNATGLSNLPWGDSRALQQGDLVFAFGNPFGLNFTMTHGLVSGKGRQPAGSRTNLRAPGDYIQTDAAINPGNSGGPLVNVRGEVVGVNSFIFTSTGTFSGEAFAIPSEIAEPIAATLISKGKVVRGYLGINIQDITPETAKFFNVPPNAKGALVSTVTAGEPGAKAGLAVGDIIDSLNGKPITSGTDLQLATGSVEPGHQVQLGIIRDGQHKTLTATLGIAPEEQNQTARNSNAAPQPTGVRLGVRLM